MNFSIVEGSYADLDKLRDEFEIDYLTRFDLSINDLRLKYGLTHNEFNELANSIKNEHLLNKRPTSKASAKYYYKVKSGFVISKNIDCRMVYMGYVKSETLAIELVEKCKKLAWDVAKCRRLVRSYYGS